MAIKGYLSEIAFVELLKVVGNYNGKLRVWNLTDSKQYECFFYNRSVIYLNFCGKSVTADELVKDVFFELLTDCKSYYAFENDSASPADAVPLVSVKELLDFSVFETAEANDDLLPHIETRFETVTKSDLDLQGELAGFWRDSLKLLHKGCSGYDLCIELGLEERLVRQNLYRLRTGGLIKPMRAFKAADSLAKSRILKQSSGSFVNGHSNGHPPLPRSAQYRPPSFPQNVIPPDFLLKEPQPLPLPEDDLLVSNNLPPVQNSAVNNSLYLQDNQSFADVKDSESLSDHSLQVSVDELPTAVHAANFSTNSPNTASEKLQTGNKTLLPPKRTSLIKRMLDSLFRG